MKRLRFKYKQCLYCYNASNSEQLICKNDCKPSWTGDRINIIGT